MGKITAYDITPERGQIYRMTTRFRTRDEQAVKVETIVAKIISVTPVDYGYLLGYVNLRTGSHGYRSLDFVPASDDYGLLLMELLNPEEAQQCLT